MNTTLLVAKLLIGTFQGGLWIVFFAFIRSFASWLQEFPPADRRGWQTLIAVILFSIFYSLGIVINRIADSLFFRWENRIKGEIFAGSSTPTSKISARLANEQVNRQLESTRTKIRIAKVFSSNLGLTTLFALCFLAIQSQSLTPMARWSLLFFTLTLGAALTVAATFIWKSFTRGYYRMLKKQLDSSSSH